MKATKLVLKTFQNNNKSTRVIFHSEGLPDVVSDVQSQQVRRLGQIWLNENENKAVKLALTVKDSTLSKGKQIKL